MTPSRRRVLLGVGGLALAAAVLAVRVIALTPVATDLGALGEGPSFGTDVSDSGVVIGIGQAAGGLPFAWTQAGGMVHLTLGHHNDVLKGVSANGIVAGYGMLPDNSHRAFIWTATGGILNLGTAPGATQSFSTGVSRNGRVLVTNVFPTEARPFVWTAQNGFTDLGSLGGTDGQATAASPNGNIVVGYSQRADGSYHPFAWTAAGGMVAAGPPTNMVQAIGATDDGLVVSNVNDFPVRTFVWTANGGAVDIGSLGGPETRASQVGASGVVVGSSLTSAGESRAFAWSRTTGGLVELTLGGSSSRAFSVSDDGLVAGTSLLPGDAERHAFIWTEAGGIVDIGTLGGSNINAGVSRNGTVFGRGRLPGDAEEHAFVWTQAGGLVDLGTLGGITSSASAVNGHGLIAGFAQRADGETHAAVWTLRHNFSGFAQPVDNAPTFNVVKAGSAVPLKFSLGGNFGLDILAPNSPTSHVISCSASSPLADIEQTVSAAASGLTYDASTNQYVYVWKTAGAWKNTCRQLTLRLDDGTDHIALFKFK